MSFIQYLWEVFCLACSSAWGISGFVAQIISIIIGIIIWKRPAKESTMKHLPWLIPLGVFGVWLLIMLTIVPYKIVKDQKDIIIKYENAQKQIEQNTKQDIRTLLESINPQILIRIDAKEKNIDVWTDPVSEGKLLALSERANFKDYLTFEKSGGISININKSKDEEKSRLIRGVKDNLELSVYHLHPKDALVK